MKPRSCGGKMQRALIVEDHDIVRALLKACVGKVAEIDIIDDVMSAEEALDLFEPGKYNLIVIDLALVELNGVELALIS
jgi:CheY-like chemotaxis protein